MENDTYTTTPLNSVEDRIKHVRRDILKLSQLDFANRIEVDQPKVSKAETGQWTELMLRRISDTFSINYTWLAEGSGSIQSLPIQDSLLYIKHTRNLNDFEYKFLQFYLDLPEKERQFCTNILSDFFKFYNK